MAEYQYKARDASGGLRTGTIQANSRTVASSQLRGQGLILVGLETVESVSPGSGLIDWSQWLKPRPIDVELSLQQLSMMLKSGTTLLAAVNALMDQAPRKSLGTIWGNVSDDIQAGASLSAAVMRHNCFPDFVIQMIQVGERTGELSPVLNRSIATMRNRRRGIQSLISALIYPLLVLIVAIGVTVYMIVYLIPRLELYLNALGRDMPVMTQRLINMSVWLREYYAILIVVAVTIPVFLIVAYKSRDGRLWFDRTVLRVPIVGRLIRLCETSAVSRSLSIMLGSGITLIDGLGTVQNVVYNQYIANLIGRARDKIIQGSSFSDTLDDRTAFSPMLKQMVAVGQKSGDLKGVLQEVADYQDELLSALIGRLNAIVTPALTIVVGAIVGYVYIAFFVALLSAGS